MTRSLKNIWFQLNRLTKSGVSKYRWNGNKFRVKRNFKIGEKLSKKIQKPGWKAFSPRPPVSKTLPRLCLEFTRNLPGIYGEFTEKLLGIYPELYQEFTHNLLRIYTEFTQKYCSHKQKSVLIQKENNNKNNKAIFKTSRWKRFEKRFKNSQKKKRTKIDLRTK